jgi:uncharacterized peroxidase-related enzyme
MNHSRFSWLLKVFGMLDSSHIGNANRAAPSEPSRLISFLKGPIMNATTINVPTRAQVSSGNQAIFDTLQSKLGFVPNLYATFAHSETALGSYLQLQSIKTSLNLKEREVINLVVSQVNECHYCLAAHTALGKMAGFSNAQIIDLRKGRAPFDAKLDALAQLVRSIASNRGKADAAALERFFSAGYTQGNLVDAIVVIGDKIITNYLHSTTQVPVDFPEAPAI